MFPKDSAWGDHQKKIAMIQAAGMEVPPDIIFRTPEENRRIADENRKGGPVSIPLDVLEGWIRSIELIENDGDAIDMANELRSYLPN